MLRMLLKKLLLFSLMFFSFCAEGARFFSGLSEKAICRSIYGIYAFGPSLGIGVGTYYHLKKPEQYFRKEGATLVEGFVADFVKKELVVAQLPHAQAVTVYKMPQANLGSLAAAFGDNTIILSDDLVGKIQKGTDAKAHYQANRAGVDVDEVKRKLEWAEYSVNDARGIIHHEAGHLKNKDCATRMVAGTASPFLIHGAIACGRRFLRKPPISGVSYATSLIAGVAVNLASQALTTGLYRQQERRADHNIANDINILRARALTHRIDAANSDNMPLRVKLQGVIFPILDPRETVKFPQFAHPSRLSRAAAFEARAKKLEEASQVAAKKTG